MLAPNLIRRFYFCSVGSEGTLWTPAEVPEYHTGHREETASFTEGATPDIDLQQQLFQDPR